MTLGMGIVAGMYVVLALAGVFANALLPFFAGAPGRGALPTRALCRHPVSARLCVSENRLLSLENALGELCSAVLHADDIGLLEQHSTGMGRIYLDGGFNMSRPPLMLRAAVRLLVMRYDLPVRPVQHTWLSRNHSDSLPGGRVDFLD